MKKFWGVIIALAVLVALMIPAAAPVAAQVQPVEYIETLYLVDTLNLTADDGSTIFTVELVEGTPNKAVLTELTGMPDNAIYDTVAALACSPDGGTLYVVDRDTSWLAKYDIDTTTWTQIGATGLGNCVQLTCSLDGTLYAASNDSDDLYTLDTSTATPTLVGATAVNVQGADIVFAVDEAIPPNQTLYLWTDGGTQGLYILDASTGHYTSYIGNSSPDYSFTGLAIREGGTGDLLGSTTDDYIRQIDPSNAQMVISYEMYFNDASYDYQWGDMTVGALAVEVQENPSIDITKSTDFVGRVSLGDTIDYTFAVTNTGDMDLMAADGDDWWDIVTDTLVAEITYDYGDDGDEILNPEETWYYYASYGPLGEGDIASCVLTNTATATAYYDYDEDPVSDTDSVSVDTSKRLNLWAGQYTDVGFVEIWNDSENVYIKYQVDDGEAWEITEVHLYVGSNEPPTNAPGQFPFDIGDASSVTPTTVEFVIPLDEINEYMMQLNSKGKTTGVMIPNDAVTPGVAAGEPIYIAAHTVVSDAPVGQATGVIYATRISNGTKGLWEIDVINGTFSLLKEFTGGAGDINNGTAYSNALAFDPATNTLYFTTPTSVAASVSPLWSYNIDTDTLTWLVDLEGSVVGACFYQGAYYFMVEGGNVLYKIDNFTTLTPIDVQSGFGTATDFTYGDFVISPEGIMYGSTRVAPQMFFSLDIDSGVYNEFAGSNALDLQLAIGSNGVLYGVNHGSGKFYAVDMATGIATELTPVEKGFADLASGTLFVPTFETAWGGYGDEWDNVKFFEDNNWSNYIEFFVMDCPEEE